jgi:hypothetical protein
MDDYWVTSGSLSVWMQCQAGEVVASNCGGQSRLEGAGKIASHSGRQRMVGAL